MKVRLEDLYVSTRKKISFKDRLQTLLRQIAKYSAYSFLLLYPETLVLSGLFFGGSVFWGFLLLTPFIFSPLIKFLSPAKNFLDYPLKKTAFFGFIGFLASAGFYEGLFHLGALTMLAVVSSILVSVFMVGIVLLPRWR